jgi:MinD-like ATPase involved in chromosome partitioning or flagellar assembly
VAYLGHVNRDPHVPQAVRNQVLVTNRFPNAPASACFRELARYIAQQDNRPSTRDTLVWEKLLNDWVN